MPPFPKSYRVQSYSRKNNSSLQWNNYDDSFMPWEFSAIKMIWKKSHYLTYQQVCSWCHDDVSLVNHTWQEIPEWLKPVVIMIRKHFHRPSTSFFKNVYFCQSSSPLRPPGGPSCIWVSGDLEHVVSPGLALQHAGMGFAASSESSVPSLGRW